MSVEQVFKALGDPVRLEIVRRLSSGANYTIGALSQDLGMSRQGARKQIQVLAAASIVKLQPMGRQTRVTLEASALASARDFISRIEQQWDERLQALKEFVES